MMAKTTTSQLHTQAAQHCCFLAFAFTSPDCKPDTGFER